jgi:putative aldouronate transport system permease protein
MAIKRKVTVGDVSFDFVVALIMLIVTVVSIYPFLYIIFFSLSNSALIGKGLLLYPVGFNLDAYRLLLDDSKIPHAFLISVLRSTIGPVCSIIVTSLAAFALTHEGFMGRGFIMKFLMITMYFSSGLIPTYILMTNLHLPGTFWIYIVPSLFGVFNMVLIKTYMESLPAALEESAMMDGASYFTTLFRITMPLCKPVLAAILLFNCVGQWNSYSDTMIYNSTQTDLHTLSYVLMNFIQTSTSSVEAARQKAQLLTVNTTSLKMAMTVITVIPIMCVYPFLQKHFAKGLVVGSVKG